MEKRWEGRGGHEVERGKTEMKKKVEGVKDEEDSGTEKDERRESER